MQQEYQLRPEPQKQVPLSIHTNGSWQIIEKGTHNTPKARFHHLSFIFKHKLYVHGGTTIPATDLNDDPLDLFAYKFQDKTWEKIKTKCASKDLQFMSSHAGVVSGCRLFIFGGSNQHLKCNNNLWRLNLESYEWQKMEQRGEIPPMRQSANLISNQKNWLLLYGGINLNETQIYNTFNLYSLESKIWYKCQGNYQFIIHARMDTSLCLQNDKIYLFGGTYRNAHQDQSYLNDMYQISISIPNKNVTSKVKIKRIVTNVQPPPRSGHQLIALGQHYLLLIGGENHGIDEMLDESEQQSDRKYNSDENDINVVKDVWIFQTLKNSWVRIEIQNKNDEFRYRTAFTLTSQINPSTQPSNIATFYLFGGLSSYQQIYNDTVALEISLTQLETCQFLENNSTCKMCYERENHMIFSQPERINCGFIDDIVQEVTFPFAAFGLLIDNCMNNGASLVNIRLFQYTNDYPNKVKNNDLKITDSFKVNSNHSNNMSFRNYKKLLRIQDNSKFQWPEEELLASLVNFQANINITTTGIDKKIKFNLQKDSLRRQFGCNLKIGALRLGDSFLYISRYGANNEIVRVCLLEKQYQKTQKQYQKTQKQYQKTQQETENSTKNASKSLPTEYYEFYYYSYNTVTPNETEPQWITVREYVQQKYLFEIGQALCLRNIRNTLLILNLKQYLNLQTKKQSSELHCCALQNDILYGNEKDIQLFDKSGYNIYECVDISLRAYISSLYLKNENMNIYLSVKNNQPTQIYPQQFLEKIDRLCKLKMVMELENVIEFEFKIVELYFIPDLKKKLSFFSNGLLMYQKNRLICRYKYKLGELMAMKMHKVKDNYNLVRLFGYAELPDTIPVNLFKNDFLFHVMMEKLYSRIKFVNKFMKKRFVSNQSFKRLHPIPYNHSKLHQQEESKSQSLHESHNLQPSQQNKAQPSQENKAQPSQENKAQLSQDQPPNQGQNQLK